MAMPRQDDIPYDSLERTIIITPETFVKLGHILELAQGHTDEEISYSDVIDVLLKIAQQTYTDAQLATHVYEEAV